MNLYKAFSVATAACVVVSAGPLCGNAHAAEAPALEFGAFAGYNLMSANSELGDAAVADYVPDSAAMFGIRGGYRVHRLVAAELEAKYALSRFRTGDLAANVLGLRAHALATLTPDSTVQVFALVGIGAEKLLADKRPALSESDIDAAYYAGLGTRIPISGNFGVRLDGRMVVVPGREAIALNAEFMGSLFFGIGGGDPDGDGDGVSDAKDKCPKEAETKNGVQDDDGCPDIADADGDGVADASDKCPQAAETKNGYQDDDGCPDDPDGDGDGVADSKDKCPKEPETKNGIKDDDGCPDVADSDGDGLDDSKDKCPKEAETKNGYQDEDGCPDTEPDTDKDGVVDSKDKCPAEPETRNGYQDDDGCADKVPEVLKKVAGTVKGIEFDENKAVITSSSFKVLDQVVAVLKAQIETKVTIEGHTDDKGLPEHNRELSLARAEAVKAYLVSKGIDAGRIATVGVGSERPVADNASPGGRAKNRRIEFKLQ